MNIRIVSLFVVCSLPFTSLIGARSGPEWTDVAEADKRSWATMLASGRILKAVIKKLIRVFVLKLLTWTKDSII